MFATLKKALAVGAVLTVSTVAAQADYTVKFDQPNMGFSQGPIIVESTDGVKWSRIKSTKLTLRYAIFIGHNSEEFTLADYRILQDGKTISEPLAVPLDGYNNPHMKSSEVEGSTDNFNSITKTNLRSACNQRLTQPGAIYMDQNLFFKVPLSMVARFSRYSDLATFNKVAYGHTMVQVVCKAFKDPVREKKKLKISKVSFQAYASKGSAAKPNSCPKQRVARVRFEANRKGQVKVQLVRGNGTTTTHKVPVFKPEQHHNFFVLDSKWVQKSETENYYMIVMGHKISVGWKTVDIKCPKPVKPGAGDKQTETKPNTAKPKPQNSVRPVRPVRPAANLATPKLTCIGGKIKLNNCYCKPNFKKLKVARHTYRCVRMTTIKVPNTTKPQRQRRKTAQQQQQQQPSAARRLFKTVR